MRRSRRQRCQPCVRAECHTGYLLLLQQSARPFDKHDLPAAPRSGHGSGAQPTFPVLTIPVVTEQLSDIQMPFVLRGTQFAQVQHVTLFYG